jgi:hypothetical protein
MRPSGSPMMLLLMIIFGPALLFLAISIPLLLLGTAAQAWAKWRRVPLQQKNHTRATFGGFLLALSIGAVASGVPFRHPGSVWAVAGAGGFGLLYLVVGVLGSRGAAFDSMSVFWWSVGALGCAAALLHFEGII